VRFKAPADIHEIKAGEYNLTVWQLYAIVRAIDAKMSVSSADSIGAEPVKPDADDLGPLKHALTALSPEQLAIVSDAIMAAHKVGPGPNLDLETTFREAGNSLIASDRMGAETFFKLSEMYAEVRVYWDEQGGKKR
jgi:hypothetical protein